jgi:hypothetical protein
MACGSSATARARSSATICRLVPAMRSRRHGDPRGPGRSRRRRGIGVVLGRLVAANGGWWVWAAIMTPAETARTTRAGCAARMKAISIVGHRAPALRSTACMSSATRCPRSSAPDRRAPLDRHVLPVQCTVGPRPQCGLADTLHEVPADRGRQPACRGPRVADWQSDIMVPGFADEATRPGCAAETAGCASGRPPLDASGAAWFDNRTRAATAPDQTTENARRRPDIEKHAAACSTWTSSSAEPRCLPSPRPAPGPALKSTWSAGAMRSARTASGLGTRCPGRVPDGRKCTEVGLANRPP